MKIIFISNPNGKVIIMLKRGLVFASTGLVYRLQDAGCRFQVADSRFDYWQAVFV